GACSNARHGGTAQRSGRTGSPPDEGNRHGYASPPRKPAITDGNHGHWRCRVFLPPLRDVAQAGSHEAPEGRVEQHPAGRLVWRIGQCPRDTAGHDPCHENGACDNDHLDREWTYADHDRPAAFRRPRKPLASISPTTRRSRRSAPSGPTSISVGGPMTPQCLSSAWSVASLRVTSGRTTCMRASTAPTAGSPNTLRSITWQLTHQSA